MIPNGQGGYTQQRAPNLPPGYEPLSMHRETTSMPACRPAFWPGKRPAPEWRPAHATPTRWRRCDTGRRNSCRLGGRCDGTAPGFTELHRPPAPAESRQPTIWSAAGRNAWRHWHTSSAPAGCRLAAGRIGRAAGPGSPRYFPPQPAAPGMPSPPPSTTNDPFPVRPKRRLITDWVPRAPMMPCCRKPALTIKLRCTSIRQ